MSFSYRSIVTLLSAIILASLLQLIFFAAPKNNPLPELTAQQIRQDLYALLSQIEQYSGFYALAMDNTNAQLSHVASLIVNQHQDITPHARFAAEITKLLNTLKDPGVLVQNFDDKSGELPLILRPLNEQWLALDKDNSPINSQFPFITHIDGLPIHKWVTASQAYLPEPARQSQEMQWPWLKKLNLLREDLGLSIKPYVLITLINDDMQTQQVTLALAPKQSQVIDAIAKEDDNREPSVFDVINQLSTFERHEFQDMPHRLATVNTTTVKLKISDLSAFELDKALQQELFKGMTHPLLIIDLRDAKGFSPKLLTMLSRYQDTDLNNTLAPNVMGFAHYRRSPKFRNDYLKPLNFMPLDTLEYSAPRLKALTRNLPTVNDDKFSPWYVRTKPVVTPEGRNRLALLVSPHCRQECEWIAYRTRLWSRVNLIGEKTSGDFDRHYYFKLPNSGLDIRLSSSLTYDAQGKLLSGVGTEPDILLPQNNDIQWQGLVSLVRSAKPKPQQGQPSLQPIKLAQSKLN